MDAQPPAGPLAETDVPSLVRAWSAAVDDLVALVAGLDGAAWATPTRCPGWTVGDVVAHVVGIERVLLGDPDPAHEPDWSALPHVRGPHNRVTEVAVDLRRGRPAAAVVAELVDVAARRRAALAGGPAAGAPDPDAVVHGPFDAPLPLRRVMRMRCVDVWVHDQDVRVALDRPGDLATPAAWVVADQLAEALGFVWARGLDPPEGSTLGVRVTGPGVEFRRAVVRTGRRGEPVEPPADPTVGLEVGWPAFVALAGGRVDPADPAARAALEAGGLRLSGDPALGAALLPALSVMP